MSLDPEVQRLLVGRLLRANLDAVLLSSSAMSDLDGRPLGEKLAGDAREVTLELERGGACR